MRSIGRMTYLPDSSPGWLRYFVAAKHCEFMLGGATVQLRRLGAELAGTGRQGAHHR